MLAAIAVLCACAPALHPHAASAKTASPSQPVVETGVIAGAPYRIDIPAPWNGELVVNAHGYEVVGAPRTEPWPFPRGLDPLLAQGFAVAASGYSAQGWAVDEAIVDTEALRRHFVARHGPPRRTWMVGWSMGGLVALASAEAHPRAYDGVVSMCGVNAPTATMIAEGALAPLAAFDALFPRTLPQAPGGLADGALPAEADGEAIESALAADPARADALSRRFDIPRDDLAGTLWLYYVALRELQARSGGFPVSTHAGDDGVVGDEAALEVRIRRYVADPRASASVRGQAPLRGSAPVPVVLQANAVDPIVPARISSRYAALAEAAGRGDRVTSLPPVGDGHCRFPGDALPAALEVLRSR